MPSDDHQPKRTVRMASVGTGAANQRRFWLRFGGHDVELQPGETLIGRSPKCQIVVDDPMVSRRHARLLTHGDSVTIEDLGSVNGVLVNGRQLDKKNTLEAGDRIVIGQQSFELHVGEKPAEQPPAGRSAAQTLAGAVSLDDKLWDEDRSEATRQGDAFLMLAGVAEKVLALGRGEEAERILAHYLRNLLQTARQGGEVDPEVFERAAHYAVRIADATGKGGWVDYVFELYTVARQPLPVPVVERLYVVIRKVRGLNLTLFRRYLSALGAVERQLGPSERFVVRRIQGLEGLAVWN